MASSILSTTSQYSESVLLQSLNRVFKVKIKCIAEKAGCVISLFSPFLLIVRNSRDPLRACHKPTRVGFLPPLCQERLYRPLNALACSNSNTVDTYTQTSSFHIPVPSLTFNLSPILSPEISTAFYILNVYT